MWKLCFFFFTEQEEIILSYFFVNRNFAFNDSCRDVSFYWFSPMKRAFLTESTDSLAIIVFLIM